MQKHVNIDMTDDDSTVSMFRGVGGIRHLVPDTDDNASGIREVEVNTAWVGTIVEATFNPKRRDDLKPLSYEFIGMRLRWRNIGIQDEGPYAGQAMWEPVQREAWFGWVPQEDLSNVVLCVE